jgi:hypothetical protein
MLRAFLRYCKRLGKDGDDADTFKDPALAGTTLDCDAFICPCCKAKGKAKGHGSYERNYVYLKGGGYACVLITIARVRCTSCDTTHAILPLTVVPNSVFSIMFIAAVVKEHLEHAFLSMEALAGHYQISLSTLKRLIRRFSAAARVAFGILEGSGRMLWAAATLASDTLEAIDSFLESFFSLRGRSFCQT